MVGLTHWNLKQNRALVTVADSNAMSGPEQTTLQHEGHGVQEFPRLDHLVDEGHALLETLPSQHRSKPDARAPSQQLFLHLVSYCHLS